MSKRKHTQLKAVEDLILAMHQDGMTLREIGGELGLILILTSILSIIRGWHNSSGCRPPS